MSSRRPQFTRQRDCFSETGRQESLSALFTACPRAQAHATRGIMMHGGFKATSALFSALNVVYRDCVDACQYTGWSDVAESVATIRSPRCGYKHGIMHGVNGRRFIVLFKQHSIRWFMKMSAWSLACRQSVSHSDRHLSEFYPQDGGESQLSLKLRRCHPVYIRQPQPCVADIKRRRFESLIRNLSSCCVASQIHCRVDATIITSSGRISDND